MTATATEVSCPICQGRMWDNRENKKNPKAPDFKCRDKSCEGVIWPPKNGAPPRTTAPTVTPRNTSYTSEGASMGGILPGENPADLSVDDRRSEVRRLHAACFKHVCENYVKVAAEHGVDLSLEGVSALTFQLYKAQSDV